MPLLNPKFDVVEKSIGPLQHPLFGTNIINAGLQNEVNLKLACLANQFAFHTALEWQSASSLSDRPR